MSAVNRAMIWSGSCAASMRRLADLVLTKMLRVLEIQRRRRILRDLPDHALKDIGIARSAIECLVRRSVDGVPLSSSQHKKAGHPGAVVIAFEPWRQRLRPGRQGRDKLLPGRRIPH